MNQHILPCLENRDPNAQLNYQKRPNFLITVCNDKNLNNDSEENSDNNVPNNEVIVKQEEDIDEDFKF